MKIFILNLFLVLIGCGESPENQPVIVDNTPVVESFQCQYKDTAFRRHCIWTCWTRESEHYDCESNYGKKCYAQLGVNESDGIRWNTCGNQFSYEILTKE